MFLSFSMMNLQTPCQFQSRSSYLSGCVCCVRYVFISGISVLLVVLVDYLMSLSGFSERIRNNASEFFNEPCF